MPRPVRGTRTPGSGKKKGTPNRVTTEMREACLNLLNRNMPKLNKWLDEVAEDDPAKAFELLVKVMEFALPKLARIDSSINGNQDSKVTIKFISAIQAAPNSVKRDVSCI